MKTLACVERNALDRDTPFQQKFPSLCRQDLAKCSDTVIIKQSLLLFEILLF